MPCVQRSLRQAVRQMQKWGSLIAYECEDPYWAIRRLGAWPAGGRTSISKWHSGWLTKSILAASSRNSAFTSDHSPSVRFTITLNLVIYRLTSMWISKKPISKCNLKDLKLYSFYTGNNRMRGNGNPVNSSWIRIGFGFLNCLGMIEPATIEIKTWIQLQPFAFARWCFYSFSSGACGMFPCGPFWRDWT